MSTRLALQTKPLLHQLGLDTRRAFSSAGRHYYFHDERWGCDVDLLRSVSVPARPRVIELGSSVAVILRTTGLLYPDYRSLTALDYAPSLCALAERELAHVPRSKVVCASIEDFLESAPRGSADIVLLVNNTLGNCWAEGSSAAHFAWILSQIRRLLSREGILLLGVYSRQGVTLGRYGNGLELVEDLGDGDFVGRVTRARVTGTFFSHLFEATEVLDLLAESRLSVVRHVDRDRRLIYVCKRG